MPAPSQCRLEDRQNLYSSVFSATVKTPLNPVQIIRVLELPRPVNALNDPPVPTIAGTIPVQKSASEKEMLGLATYQMQIAKSANMEAKNAVLRR
jgi:hypothetical protein